MASSPLRTLLPSSFWRYSTTVLTPFASGPVICGYMANDWGGGGRSVDVRSEGVGEVENDDLPWATKSPRRPEQMSVTITHLRRGQRHFEVHALVVQVRGVPPAHLAHHLGVRCVPSASRRARGKDRGGWSKDFCPSPLVEKTRQSMFSRTDWFDRYNKHSFAVSNGSRVLFDRTVSAGER